MALTIGTGLTIGGGITLQAIFPPAPWTWNPRYVGEPGITLSNGNLVVTANNTMTGEPSVLGTYPIPPNSKIMFSVCALIVTTNDVSGIGVGSHSMNINDYIGANFTTSQGVYEDGGNFTQTQTPASTGLTYDSLSTIDVAIDRVNGLFWYRVGALGAMSAWNDGYNSADPATATGGYPISDLVGTVYPAAGPFYTGSDTPPTGSFGANSQPGGAVPEGFTFAAATAPVWYWNSLGSEMITTFSGRTVYDNAPGTYSALGNYAVGDTAQIVYSVQLSYDLDPSLPQNQAVGFGLNSTNLENGLGTDDKSMAVYNNGIVYWVGNDIYTGLPTFAAGDIIDVALTGTYRTPGWWYRVNGGDWNGDPTANPATGTGGFYQYVDDTVSPIYPAVSIAGNTGPSVFTIQDVPLYPIPSGFTFLGTSQVAAPLTAGLQVNLDAAAYSGSGPWIDSVNGAQYNLFNDPTYSATIGGGSFGFDPALSQYAYCTSTPATMTNWTVEVWHYYDGTTAGGEPCIVSQELGAGIINFAIGSLQTTPPTLRAGFFNGAWQTQTAQTLSAGNWYQIVGICSNTDVTLCINGVAVASAPWSGGPPASSGLGTYLMHRWDSGDVWGGRLGIVRIYDTDIGAAGVLQNFNADRARFGI